MEVKLLKETSNTGSFVIESEGVRDAEMGFSVKSNKLTVDHTFVSEKLRGQNIAKKLLTAMVDHARRNNYKVIPVCTYVEAQFKRHPELYADVWEREKV